MTPFTTSRDIPAAPAAVFAAIATPERLARWWGPAGFRNTFAVCDFRPGGRWSFVMHGPDGAHYQNDSQFAEIAAPTRVVIQHLSEPTFRLTITLAASATGTRVSWVQALDDAEVARRVQHIVIPANEQNLDRLTAEVLRPQAPPAS